MLYRYTRASFSSSRLALEAGKRKGFRRRRAFRSKGEKSRRNTPLLPFYTLIHLEARLKGEWGCLRVRVSFVMWKTRHLTARGHPPSGPGRNAGWVVRQGWRPTGWEPAPGPEVQEGPQSLSPGTAWLGGGGHVRVVCGSAGAEMGVKCVAQSCRGRTRNTRGRWAAEERRRARTRPRSRGDGFIPSGDRSRAPSPLGRRPGRGRVRTSRLPPGRQFPGGVPGPERGL
ncbi:uncharacterized protein LOC117802275 [Ailuropoda melanoleuca]|uniref:uncharacterized protein LOC117802275 n=1 Tax=Ailuropoda melanoleuca TaxID=9646 RepID=UPI0014942D82|nr:uncharacterized protein LOC117802275 [Ailuropoda melanoleuca]